MESSDKPKKKPAAKAGGNKKKGKKQEKPSLSKRSKIIILVVFWFAVLSPYIVISVMLEVASNKDLPSFYELENPKSNLATEVYTADGEMIGRYFTENRTNVNYSQISPYMIDALVSTEDERFFEHSGVDVQSLPRVVKGVLSGDQSKGGGSTISQQLSKMLFPRDELTKWELIQRKFKEWIIATRLEKSYTKEEIITMYLNKFDFLNHAVGIASASKVYFNTTPDSLRKEQAALLVGMAKNPSLFNPLRFPEKARARRNVVLGQWLKNSKEDNPVLRTKLTQEEHDSLVELPLQLDYQVVDHQVGLAPYFREIVREELKTILESKEGVKFKYTKPDGTPYDVYRDGLRVYTTLDSRLQRHAEKAVKKHLGETLQDKFYERNKDYLKENYPFSRDLSEEDIESIIYQGMRKSDRWQNMLRSGMEHEEIAEVFEKPIPMKVFSWDGDIDTVMSPKDSVRYYKQFLRAGLMSVDPHTGYVKAWVGGPDFFHFKYDHVKKARRQVGSTFKPFVYASAMDLGVIEPCTTVPHTEHCVQIPYNNRRNKEWCPKNAGLPFDGKPISMKSAVAGSINSVTAWVVRQTGMEPIIKLVEALGIPEGLLEPVPAIGLGVCDLSVYEMTSAQASFANKGVYIEPVIISRIEDSHGNVIYDANPKMTEAFDEQTAWLTLNLMKGVTSCVYDNVRSKYFCTAGGIRGSYHDWGGLEYPLAGKTGTTQNGSDGWFIGLTPDLVTGIWVGAEDRSVHFPYITWGQGGRMALPIFGYYMKDVYADESIEISTGDFEPPTMMGDVKLDCSDNGDIDFSNGNEPDWGS